MLRFKKHKKHIDVLKLVLADDKKLYNVTDIRKLLWYQTPTIYSKIKKWEIQTSKNPLYPKQVIVKKENFIKYLELFIKKWMFN